MVAQKMINTTTASLASIVVSAQQPLTTTMAATTIQSTNSVSSTPAKKPRPKTASPTRHGPQQCQVREK